MRQEAMETFAEATMKQEHLETLLVVVADSTRCHNNCFRLLEAPASTSSQLIQVRIVAVIAGLAPKDAFVPAQRFHSPTFADLYYSVSQ